jgi:hypothetical protein
MLGLGRDFRRPIEHVSCDGTMAIVQDQFVSEDGDIAKTNFNRECQYESKAFSLGLHAEPGLARSKVRDWDELLDCTQA